MKCVKHGPPSSNGLIHPVLDRVLPMSQLGKAHALLESRSVTGKVVVEQDLCSV